MHCLCALFKWSIPDVFKRQGARGVIRMVQYPWVSTNFLQSIAYACVKGNPVTPIEISLHLTEYISGH